MTQLYTPWMTQAGQTLGNAIAQRGQNQLYSSAYMGEPGAMERLMQVNPAMGQQLVQQRQQAEQLKLEQAAKLRAEDTAKTDKLRKIATENKAFFDKVLEDGSKLDSFDKFASFIENKRGELETIIGQDAKLLPSATPEMWENAKQIYGEKPKEKEGFTLGKDQVRYDAEGNVIAGQNQLVNEGGEFEGTAMDAQVSNILIRGTTDPNFRNTPAYARAWQLATEPKIIRTPTGDMLQSPTIPPMFKPPGTQVETPLATEDQKPVEAPGTPKPAVIIPGTEKLSVDQTAYNKDYTILKKSSDSMRNYIDVLEELGPQMSVGPLNTSDTQKLESAYARAMLDAKETNNLGVLNGPDVGVLRKFMGDPTGLQGQIRGKEALVMGAKEALKQIDDNFGSLNALMKDTPVKTKKLEGDETAIKINDQELSATVGGKKWVFPNKQALDQYKAANGL